MNGNASPNTPPAPDISGWYERYKRWYWAHVLHRFPTSKRRRIVNYAKASLAYHNRMVYTEGPSRSELFHRKPGQFRDAHADCSQYSASLCHWVGVRSVTDTDWTGTLGKKGVAVQLPKPGMFVFFGQSPYVHMGVMIDKGHVIGFGQQLAPDVNTLSGLLAYFSSKGHPGHTFRDLAT